MSTGYTLLDFPNRTLRQHRNPRRERPSGVVVVHSAENAPDTFGADGGAEAVARFISTRTDPGSYHRVCDSDSTVAVVPWWMEAWHDGTGTNPHSVGISAATQADRWPTMPQAWSDGCVEQMARAAADYAAWLHATHGTVIPARRITTDQARNRQPGFLSHAELDPVRRTDPGAGFPWQQFLTRFAQLTNQGADEMNQAQEAKLDRVLHLLDEGLEPGWGRLGHAILTTNHLAKVIHDRPSVDVQALAAAVVAALPTVTAAGVDVNALARAVADELHRRMAA